MANKHSPVIRISPPEFQFYPVRQGAGFTARLHVKNLIENSVAFKFKTNAPTRYSVKPVLAVLHPGDAIETYVRSETPISDQDKFLIQSVPLTEEESDMEMTSAEVKKKNEYTKEERNEETWYMCGIFNISLPNSGKLWTSDG
ncbi:unnamed protein product [Umbelopsis ramanniana]